LTELTRDRALPVRTPEALAIDDLRDERRLFGAVSVGPYDMDTQVMSVARGDPPQYCTERLSAELLQTHQPENRD
jgi:hypothetical protein